jgi:hypothetical protein
MNPPSAKHQNVVFGEEAPLAEIDAALEVHGLEIAVEIVAIEMLLPAPDVSPSPVKGALLHFKLFHDFRQRVISAVEGKQFRQNSAEYVVYLDGLNKRPELTAFCEKSERFVFR